MSTFHSCPCGLQAGEKSEANHALACYTTRKSKKERQKNMPKTTEEVKLHVLASFKAKRDEVIAANGNTRFAEKEQLEVIEHLVELLVNDEDVAAEGYSAIAPFVAAVSNASAFAQLLEKSGKIHRAKKGTGGVKATMAA